MRVQKIIETATQYLHRPEEPSGTINGVDVSGAIKATSPSWLAPFRTLPRIVLQQVERAQFRSEVVRFLCSLILLCGACPPLVILADAFHERRIPRDSETGIEVEEAVIRAYKKTLLPYIQSETYYIAIDGRDAPVELVKRLKDYKILPVKASEHPDPPNPWHKPGVILELGSIRLVGNNEVELTFDSDEGTGPLCVWGHCRLVSVRNKWTVKAITPEIRS